MLLHALWDVSLVSYIPYITYSLSDLRYSPIQSVTPVMQGRVVVKLGVFERVPQPEWEQFAVRRQDWEKPFEGCVQYKLLGGPGKEEL